MSEALDIVIRQQGGRTLALPKTEDKNGENGQKTPGFGNLLLVHNVEALSWGDAGLYLSTPGGGLGGAAVEATGTPDQRVRFLAPFDPVVWDRRRFEHFWNWEYRLEAYTPPAKRKFVRRWPSC